jgi:hypothetical protein
MHRRILALAAAVALAGCTPMEESSANAGAAAPAAPLSQQEAELFLNTFVSEVRVGDTTKLSSYFAPYATFISPRGRIDSRDSIVKFWSEAVKAGAGKTLELHPARFGSGGNVAWQLSHFTGGVTAPTGYVLTVLQREPDGAVKAVAQLSVPDAARQ